MPFRYLHLATEPPGLHLPDEEPIPTAHLLRPVNVEAAASARARGAFHPPEPAAAAPRPGRDPPRIRHGYRGAQRRLPMVLLPLGADQPYNAACCAALGVGVVIDPAERTPAVIQAAVRAVLAAPSYRQNAARTRDEMAALPGPEHGVALLERLAEERRPIPAA